MNQTRKYIHNIIIGNYLKRFFSNLCVLELFERTQNPLKGITVLFQIKAMAEVVLWNHYPKTNALLFFFLNLAAYIYIVYRKNCLNAERFKQHVNITDWFFLPDL